MKVIQNIDHFEFKDIFKPEYYNENQTYREFFLDNLAAVNRLVAQRNFVVINSRFLPNILSADSFIEYEKLKPLFVYFGNTVKQYESRVCFITSPKIDFSKKGKGLLELSYLAWLLDTADLDTTYRIITPLGRLPQDLTNLARTFANKISHRVLKRMVFLPNEQYDIKDCQYVQAELFELCSILVPIIPNFNLLKSTDVVPFAKLNADWNGCGNPIRLGHIRNPNA